MVSVQKAFDFFVPSQIFEFNFLFKTIVSLLLKLSCAEIVNTKLPIVDAFQKYENNMIF